MREFKKHMNTLDLSFTLDLSSFPKNAVLFDIETTGFSRKKEFIYLIGLCFQKEHGLCIMQYLAEEKEDERNVLKSFLNILESFSTLISFNGTSFDLPFIKERCASCKLELVDDKFTYVDLFQCIHAYRSFFQLENYRQTTLERYLGIEREDTFTGGELIPVYEAYVKDHSNLDSLQLLLQHNQDDVVGMAGLLPLLRYRDFFEGGFNIEECHVSSYTDIDGSSKPELLIKTVLPAPLPVPFRCGNGTYYLHAEEGTVHFRIPIVVGVLKHFYPDYKNYYYLPAEDIAIHKDLAAFVDRTHRQKAKASTCYGKKEGWFLPQPQGFAQPSFYQEYRGTAYFEYTSERAADLTFLKNYCMCILDLLKTGA